MGGIGRSVLRPRSGHAAVDIAVVIAAVVDVVVGCGGVVGMRAIGLEVPIVAGIKRSGAPTVCSRERRSASGTACTSTSTSTSTATTTNTFRADGE